MARRIYYLPSYYSTGAYATTLCWVNYQLLAEMLLRWPNGQLTVVVDHNQLRTVASETVDPIDWRLPLPFTGQYLPKRQMCDTNQDCSQLDSIRALQNTRPFRHSWQNLVKYFFKVKINKTHCFVVASVICIYNQVNKSSRLFKQLRMYVFLNLESHLKGSGCVTIVKSV